MQRVKLVSLFLIILSSITQAIAQEQKGLPSDSAKFLNEITISAFKSEEARRNIAQQIQLLTAKEIKFLQPQTTADLVAQSGTVSVQKSQQGGGSPVIRGFEASRILLVLDGVRMNNIIYRSGHLQNILTVDNNNIERLEILSGPASCMYGSDALGGVIVMNTKEPKFGTDDSTLHVSAGAMYRYATANKESTGNIQFNIGNKHFASFTSATYSSFNDLRGGVQQNWFYKKEYGNRSIYAERINGKDSILNNSQPENQIQSGYNQFDILQKFSYSKNNAVSHHLNLQFSSSSDIPRYDRLTDPLGNGLKFSEWYYGPQNRLLAIYSLKISREKKWMDSFSFAASFQHIEESRHTRNFGFSNKQNRMEEVKVAGINIDLLKKIHRHEFRYGAEFQFNTMKSTANEEDITSGNLTALNTRYPDGNNTMLQSTAYLSHHWHIHKKWTVVDGFRAGYSMLESEFIDKTFFPFPYSNVENNNGLFAFNGGLIFRPQESLKTSALFSSGYRVPNVDDLSKVFESAPGTLIVPNPDLGPEKTYNIELSATWNPGRQFSWENVVYYTLFRDAIVTAPSEFNGQDSLLYDGTISKVYSNQNIREAYLYGFSSTAIVNVKESWNFRATAAYTYGRIRNDSADTPLDHIPPLMTRLQVTYSKNKFRTDFISQYNSWKKIEDYYLNGEDNEQYATPEGMPAWIVFNVRLNYQLHKNLLLQAGCDNILDTQYRVFASGINAPGRNFLLTLRLNY